MDSEFGNKPQDHASEKENTREGYNPAGGYQKSYRPVGRTQRPRINTHRSSFSSDRSSSNSEGGFRPEGFGAGLQSSNTERPQHSGYQSRGGYNSNRVGGHRPQQGGYSNGGSYGRPQQGGYNSNRGGYNSNNGGGYGRPQQGGYGRPQQGGYGRPQQGGYGRPQQDGYNNNRGGGYNNNRSGGGFRQRTPGYDPNAKYSLKKRIEYKEENIDPTEPLRLNKFLANAGVCSRREADEFIQAGVVTVNGEVVTELGTKILRTDRKSVV